MSDNHAKFKKILDDINTYFPNSVSIRINNKVVEIEYIEDGIKKEDSFETQYFLDNVGYCPNCGTMLLAPFFCNRCGDVRGFHSIEYFL